MDINLKGFKSNCGHTQMGDLVIHRSRRMTESETRMAVNYGIEQGYKLGSQIPDEVMDATFDRAYALGKQTETITQEDVEKAAEAFATPPKGNGGMFTRQQVKGLLVKFAQLFLGKQEKDADTVIQGWVARDEDGHLFMYSTKPERDEALQEWMGRYANFDLRDYLFPDLTWDDDPQEVEIIIKRKKNG